MNARPTQADVRQTVKRLIPELGLEKWTIGVGFGRIDDAEAHAGCNPSWEYLDAKLWFDLEHERWTDPQVSLVRTVAHELAHCLVNPLARCARQNAVDKDLVAKLEEMVVTEIERLPFIKRLEKG